MKNQKQADRGNSCSIEAGRTVLLPCTRAEEGVGRSGDGVREALEGVKGHILEKGVNGSTLIYREGGDVWRYQRSLRSLRTNLAKRENGSQGA